MRCQFTQLLLERLHVLNYGQNVDFLPYLRKTLGEYDHKENSKELGGDVPERRRF